MKQAPKDVDKNDEPVSNKEEGYTGDEKEPGEGIDVPEEFQQAAHKLVSKASKPHLNHLRNKINSREDELRDEEMSKKGKDGKLSIDDAPSSVGAN